MASDTDETKQDTSKANAHMDATAHKEACDFWGYLIKPDKGGTELFNRLLEGIAEVIVSGDCPNGPRTCERPPADTAMRAAAAGQNL